MAGLQSTRGDLKGRKERQYNPITLIKTGYSTFTFTTHSEGPTSSILEHPEEESEK